MSNFSKVELFPVQGNAVIVARGSVVVGDLIKVKFTVMNGSNGRFVSLPAEKGKEPDENGRAKYYPHASLVSRELQDELNKIVLDQLDGKGSGETVSSKSTKKSGSAADGIPF